MTLRKKKLALALL